MHTGRRESADVSSHIPRRALAVLCRGLEKSLAELHGQSTAGVRHSMCKLAFRVSSLLFPRMRSTFACYIQYSQRPVMISKPPTIKVFRYKPGVAVGVPGD